LNRGSFPSAAPPIVCTGFPVNRIGVPCGQFPTRCARALASARKKCFEINRDEG